MNIAYDPASHEYRIDGVLVPHVTAILRDLLPGWDASEYHLALGQANHACYAMLARGQEFDADPECQPYVEAWRVWRAANKVEFSYIEQVVGSERYQYGGTLDFLATVGGRLVVGDYKATITPATEWQLAAYALALEECEAMKINTGLAVELRPGREARQVWYELRRAKQEWLALLTTWRIRRKCSVKEN